MKYIFLILFFTVSVYSQIAIEVNKTDSDSLWQDFKYMYADINKDTYSVVVYPEEHIIFYREFACDWRDIPVEVLNKIRRRLKRTDNTK